jgi:hypothetical protein
MPQSARITANEGEHFGADWRICCLGEPGKTDSRRRKSQNVIIAAFVGAREDSVEA